MPRTFGSEAVAIEAQIPVLPLLVDCVVATPSGRFAYRLIRRQLRPSERHTFKKYHRRGCDDAGKVDFSEGQVELFP